eukprot:scaffold6873_cov72-Skeletonema_marinoi.AAC.3
MMHPSLKKVHYPPQLVTTITTMRRFHFVITMRMASTSAMKSNWSLRWKTGSRMALQSVIITWS